MVIREAFILISIVLVTLCMPSFGQEQTPSYWIDKGKELSNNGSYNLAIKCYERAIDLDNLNAYAWYYKGWALGRLKKYDDAFEAYNKSVRINPLLANAWTYRGLSQLMAGHNPHDIIESFDNAIALNESDGVAWLAKGILLVLDQNMKDSKKCFDKVIQLNQSRGLAAALTYFSTSILNLQSYTYLRSLNESYTNQRILNASINGFQRSIQLAPSCPYVLGYDGLYELQKQNTNETYVDGYIIDPSQLLAANHGFEGYALLWAGNSEEAITHFNNAIDLYQSFAIAFNNSDNILNIFVNHPLSGTSIKESYIPKELLSMVWTFKGAAFQALENYNDAIKCYNTGFELGTIDVTRSMAVESLGSTKNKGAFDPLIRAIKDKSRGIRYDAAYALGNIKDPRAVDPLIEVLKNDEDSGVRSSAARALGSINDARAVEPLILAIKDNDSYVRSSAVESLGEIKDTRAVEPLMQALGDSSSNVQREAAYALGNFRDPRAVEPLIAALKSHDEDLKSVAENALGKMGANGVYSQVTNLGVPEFTWTNSNFAGFYYDIDNSIGLEQLTIRLSNVGASEDVATLSDEPDANNNSGIVYTTHAQPKDFRFKPWGQYEVIGFLGDRYFAAYDNIVTKGMADAEETMPFLYDRSSIRNLMSTEQITRVLRDDNTEMTITSNSPLKLEEGYQLDLKDVQGDKAYLMLTKNGQDVEGKVIQPSKADATMADKTYCYKPDLGDANEIVQIAVHFKHAIMAAGNISIATIDGVFQISDTMISLKPEQQYDNMSIRTVDPAAMAITMDNKDRRILLDKNRDIVLCQDIRIKTADQDATAGNPLRYYLYRNYSQPGIYDQRSTLADLGESEFTWTSAIFPGFFYDINTNIGTEKLTFRLSDASPTSAKLSDQPDANNNRGIVYATQAQPKSFKFKPWGQYEVIGFLGDKYFAAYDNVLTQGVVNANENLPFLFDRSSDRNLLAKGQLGRVLIDDNAEISINSVLPLKLKEDYELALKYVNGTKACLELKKDGQIIDTKIIQPTLMGATMSDKTYYYKRDLGSNVGIVTIAVHLGNCAHGLDMDSATIDGIFQISETPYTITSDQKYGIMSIRNINPTDLSITLDNKDNEIALRKDKDIPLMGRIYIKTADQSDVEGTTPLRYYIYSREWGPALDDEEESISKKAGYALGIANESGRQGWVAEVKPESSIPLEDNESRKVLESAALAIESQDEKGFTELLSNETLRGVSGEPDLSSPEALKIAEGMKSAKFIGMAGDAVIYEMAIGNATYSFTTIKEEGVWKISGF